MRRRFAGVLIAVLCILLFCTPALSVQGDQILKASSDSNLVRVGFPLQGGLGQKDEYGNYSGYTYEYLQEIAQYTGWEYEFVEFSTNSNESLLEMLDMLSTGELDIVGGMAKNEQTEQVYDLPEYGYGFSYMALVATEENISINENNFQSAKNLRIAVFKKSVVNRERAQAFLKLNNVDYSFVEFDTEVEMLAAIRNGSADVMIVSDLTPIAGTRIIAQFEGAPFYFGVTKGNTKILNELNSTIFTIQKVKPTFNSLLYDKYFSIPSQSLYLSDAEKQYIHSAPPLRIAMIKAYEPIQFEDDEGVLRGIAKDVLDRIQEETGMTFLYVMAEDYLDAFRLLDEGRVDAVCGIPYDYQLAQEHSLILSNCFMSTQMVLVTRDGQKMDLTDKKVSIVDRHQSPSYLNLTNLVKFGTLRECLDAVISGEVDCAYVNLYSAEYLSSTAKYKSLRFIPQSGSAGDFCLGIRKPVNSNLISVFNKALAHFPDEEMETIIYQSTAGYYPKATLSAFVEENPFLAVGIIGTVFLALLSVGMVILRVRIQASKRLDVENQRYRLLCELANEFIYEYDCRQDTVTFSREFAELFALPDKITQFIAVMRGDVSTPEPLNPDVFGLFKQLMTNPHKNAADEYLCLLPTGEQRWYRNAWARIEDKEGKTIYVIGKLTDVQDEREEKEKLEHRLMLDGLTGIYNTAASQSVIDERLKNLRGASALLIMDIDFFKGVNDQLGHYMGDVVLKDFAKMLSNLSGKWDIAGRLGGDEFILYVDSAGSAEKLSRFCASLCEQAAKTYTNSDGVSRQITISLGAVMIHKSCRFGELYQAVDKALYQSKKQGRNRYTVVDLS